MLIVRLKRLVSGTYFSASPYPTSLTKCDRYAKSIVTKVQRAIGLETDSSEIVNEALRATRKFGTISLIAVSLFSHLPRRLRDNCLLTCSTGLCCSDERVPYWCVDGEGYYAARRWTGQLITPRRYTRIGFLRYFIVPCPNVLARPVKED